MIRMLVIGVLCAVVLGSVGCEGIQPMWTAAKPETTFTINPLTKTIHFHNSKDVHVKWDRVHLKSGDTEGEITGFDMTDNASDVRTANVAQLQEATKQIQAVTATVDHAMSLVAPGLNARLTPQSSPAAIIAEHVGAAVEEKIAPKPVAP